MIRKHYVILGLSIAGFAGACGSDEESTKTQNTTAANAPITTGSEQTAGSTQTAQTQQPGTQGTQTAQTQQPGAQGTRAMAPQKKDIVDTAAATGQFTTLIKAVQEAGLSETLKGPGPYTVFAPTDEAFNKLPANKLDDLLKPENKAKLTALLNYHIIPGEIRAADIATLKTTKTVNGKSLKIKATSDEVRINNARVVSTDIEASNGIVHVIDTVLMPKGK